MLDGMCYHKGRWSSKKRPKLHLGAFKWCLALSRPTWTQTAHTHTHLHRPLITQNLRGISSWCLKGNVTSVFTLTRLALVLLLSSSGMGRNTAKATQFAKMVNRMIISKALHRGSQGRNEKTWVTDRHHSKSISIHPQQVVVGKTTTWTPSLYQQMEQPANMDHM